MGVGDCVAAEYDDDDDDVVGPGGVVTEDGGDVAFVSAP